MPEQHPIGKDAEGYEILTPAIRDLLNTFPGLYPEEVIKFEELGPDDGIAFSSTNGALIMQEKEFITGDVQQLCRYPFYVVYRSASTKERQKMTIKEFLDTLGKWLSGEPAVLDGEEIRLRSWPTLASGRKIKKIMRDNSYGLEPQSNGIQDWLLPVTVEYTNDFSKW